jgi:hypothetical protein
MSGPEFNPMDDQPIDREEYEKAMADKAEGELMVGTTGKGEVVINHPDIDADKDGVGHIVFSVGEARHLAYLLLRKSDDAELELLEDK